MVKSDELVRCDIGGGTCLIPMRPIGFLEEREVEGYHSWIGMCLGLLFWTLRYAGGGLSRGKVASMLVSASSSGSGWCMLDGWAGCRYAECQAGFFKQLSL